MCHWSHAEVSHRVLCCDTGFTGMYVATGSVGSGIGLIYFMYMNKFA